MLYIVSDSTCQTPWLNKEHTEPVRDHFCDQGILWLDAVGQAACSCLLKYLNVLHHVPQLNQELFGLSGSV